MNLLSRNMRDMADTLRRKAERHDRLAEEIDQLPDPLGMLVVLPVLRGHQIENLAACLEAGNWPETAQAVRDALAREEAEVEVEEETERSARS